MARQLAELMGGEVGCNSVVGKGSLYWFTLAAAHKAAAPQVRSESEPEPLAKLSGRVLVVEDNAVNRMLIADYLEEFGLSHEMVASASTALLSLASKHYDLVLMDAMMPDLDGVETTQAHPRPACSGIGGADRGARLGQERRPRHLSLGRHGRLCGEADPRARTLSGARAVPCRQGGRRARFARG